MGFAPSSAAVDDRRAAGAHMWGVMTLTVEKLGTHHPLAVDRPALHWGQAGTLPPPASAELRMTNCALSVLWPRP